MLSRSVVRHFRGWRMPYSLEDYEALELCAIAMPLNEDALCVMSHPLPLGNIPLPSIFPPLALSVLETSHSLRSSHFLPSLSWKLRTPFALST